MWHKRTDCPLPCLHGGDIIKLTLEYYPYFGHLVNPGRYVVIATWDGLNEEFYERTTKRYILDEDIVEWWEDKK